MTLSEKFYFARQLRDAFGSIGAVIPTSRYAAAAMAAEVARRTGPKRVLEVGPGTGSITAEIIRHIGPDDTLVLCEINPGFVAYLRQRFENDPAFRAVRDRTTIYDVSVTDMPDEGPFDCIVSAVPFTSLPLEITESILARYERILRPGGTLTYIEYAGLRSLKRATSSPAARAKADAINAVLDDTIARHQFRRDLVWRNVPPAWIRHLHLAPPKPSDAATLAPLEYTHRLRAPGGISIASDALPFVGALLGLAWLLRPLRRPLLVLAALVAWFFRDPERQTLVDSELAFAACDGRVLSVETLSDARFGPGEWLRIAVFLSLADVHINRAPVAGVVREVIGEDGGYANAALPAAEHNVASYTVIEGMHGPCVVAQRVGLVARRIVNRARAGELVAQGERYGLIRFGSRTDVYLPAASWRALVTPGDRVVGGKTVIARHV